MRGCYVIIGMRSRFSKKKQTLCQSWQKQTNDQHILVVTQAEVTMGSSRREESNRSCCTWPRILLLVILLAVAGVLVWKFVPWDDTINSVLDNVPIPGDGKSDESNGGNKSDSTTTKPATPATSSPTTAPRYKFIQCDGETSGDCCNGLDSICDLRADEVLYATLHNGMATFEDGFLFGPNHKFQLEGALEAGYRGLNLDLCNCGGQTIFCHGEQQMQ